MKVRFINVSRQTNSATFSRSMNENRVVGRVGNPLPVIRVNISQSKLDK